jgi:hypothetical protein
MPSSLKSFGTDEVMLIVVVAAVLRLFEPLPSLTFECERAHRARKFFHDDDRMIASQATAVRWSLRPSSQISNLLMICYP